MKKVILVLSLSLMLLPAVAAAQENWLNWMGNVIENTPVAGKADLIGVIFRLIQYVLAFLGVIAVIIILYAGFMWMTAGGNDEKVGKAKKTLIAGVIGLVIVLLAYAIATFVIQRLEEFANTV